MSVLGDASAEERSALLRLFPLGVLKVAAPDFDGDKAELTDQLASTMSVPALATFITNNLLSCRQHVYVHDVPANFQFEAPMSLGGARRISQQADKAVYVAAVENSVTLTNPPEAASATFLWPLQLEMIEGCLAVRFVILEKSLGAYFHRPAFGLERSLEEDDVLGSVRTHFDVHQTDIHTGVKHLWHTGYMDASKARYRKPHSSSYESMDQGHGIREHDPELYELVRQCPLRACFFTLGPAAGVALKKVTIDPSRGMVGVTSYPPVVQDLTSVVRAILENC